MPKTPRSPYEVQPPHPPITPSEASFPPPPSGLAERLASIDAYRGFVMFLMMAEVLQLRKLADAFPSSKVWAFIAHHQDHVEWVGCTLHDMIQPSFSFLVGVALPFSIANRERRGESKGWLTLHAFWRAFLLVALGIFLRSVNREQTNFTFEDTLTQIGLGYGFLFLLGFRPIRDQIIALVLILVGYWGGFAYYIPPAGFDATKVGVPTDWPYLLKGFASHWNKNSNPAWLFDTWFLNLFPRPTPFTHNGGGYATLSFIPTLGTMILGLLAGGLIRSDKGGLTKVGLFIVIGATILGLGYGIAELGLCPIVKRIWTPSWVLYSGGTCFLMLAGFYLLVDLARLKPLFIPLIIIGMNSIAAYCMSGLFEGFIHKNLETNLGEKTFEVLGPEYTTTLHGAAVLFVLWLILLWMYRRRIFLRI